MSRSTNIVKERNGTTGDGETVSPSMVTAVGRSETVELYMINRTMVVVIATAAHKALVSQVLLPLCSILEADISSEYTRAL